ncbi:MAG: signal peptidase I [Rhodospirillales bacterium]|nr:signal peptidase I [Rhodospirillales bacterium]
MDSSDDTEVTTDTEQVGSIKETIITVVYAGLIALGIRSFAYEPFSIPSGSMIPTLLVGDYLFVSKLSYGYSSFSLPLGLPLIPDRILFTEPERGDVAVFRLPTNTDKDYIKRLVGLPGDKIQVVKGILHINGKAVKREKVDDYLIDNGFGSVRRVTRYLETLPNGRKHFINEEQGDDGPSDNTPIYSVPEGHYFAMGDNRDNSSDSRFMDRVGYIPRKNLIGRAEVKFFSVDGAGWKFWQWPSSARFERFFDGIE